MYCLFFMMDSERVIGMITGFLYSVVVYYDKIAENLVNSVFVIANTLLAVAVTHFAKQYFAKRDKKK